MIYKIYICQYENNKVEVLSNRGCDNFKDYQGLWKYPKKAAKFAGMIIDRATIIDQNQYALLSQIEWLMQADSNLECDEQINVSNSDRQSNASNDVMLSRKSRSRKKRTITIAGESMLEDAKVYAQKQCPR